MVAWLTAYDIELKKRVRGAQRNALDDPEVRKIIQSYEMHTP